MSNRTQLVLIAVVTLLVGIGAGWAIHGLTTFNPATRWNTLFGDWAVACPPAATGKAECQLVENIFEARSRDPIMSIQIPWEDPKPRLIFVLPLGLTLLQPGIRFNIDGEPMRTVPYRVCVDDGCVADVPIDNSLKNSLENGKAGRVIFWLVNATDGKPVEISTSFSGFNAARRALARAQAIRASWLWRMLLW